MHPFYMGLETTADAHGVLLLNSNAMGEEKETGIHTHALLVHAHMQIQPLSHRHTHTQSRSIAYAVGIYVLMSETSMFSSHSCLSSHTAYLLSTYSDE